MMCVGGSHSITGTLAPQAPQVLSVVQGELVQCHHRPGSSVWWTFSHTVVLSSTGGPDISCHLNSLLVPTLPYIPTLPYDPTLFYVPHSFLCPHSLLHPHPFLCPHRCILAFF